MRKLLLAACASLGLALTGCATEPVYDDEPLTEQEGIFEYNDENCNGLLDAGIDVGEQDFYDQCNELGFYE